MDHVPSRAERAPLIVTARRWRHGWELHLPGEGAVTQVSTLKRAEQQVRDYLATWGLDDTVEISVVVPARAGRPHRRSRGA